MSLINRCKWTAVLVPILFMTGCQSDDGLAKTVTAKGTVVCDGKPIEGAVIVLMQDSGSNFARGITDRSGNFSLDSFETKKGSVPGSYKVTISKTVTVDKATPIKAPQSLIDEATEAAGGDASKINVSWVNDLPNKYANPGTSGLTVTIPEAGVSDIKFTISRN